MTDILNEASNIAQCKECPWYRACTTPMRYTSEDIRRQVQSGSPGMNAPQDEAAMQQMLSMASAAQNSMLEACPIFIDRLRNNPKLAQKIKEIMQNWSQEST
ncbi:MAG: hypothetical protein QQM50_05475 [Dehalococcoides mccartyi]|jgi:hypothetical protein|uniref:Uncharacterized protein n=2 Tax=root TaxID=1 RepID=A0A0V8M480_9CHLR|nr:MULTISPECIES: hypothetical protein [Dehalococcoides]AII59295.1 hypothetical protein X793_02745 [Dehalococcoides mccartyi CG4]AQU03001.1 hypothetical protein B1773_02775 [Dehalococcoides mccartyi]AQU04318.1 hypothetical protein B1774_02525 [Dehalococcoides mccartyi]KSV18581.1 hypothetical protein DA01_00995 [Dehalococcoides mccartyi]MBF4482776.1 hypothetical protein [Dehalococcoides mccartyi]